VSLNHVHGEVLHRPKVWRQILPFYEMTSIVESNHSWYGWLVSTIFQLYCGDQVYWWRKSLTCRKSLTNPYVTEDISYRSLHLCASLSGSNVYVSYLNTWKKKQIKKRSLLSAKSYFSVSFCWFLYISTHKVISDVKLIFSHDFCTQNMSAITRQFQNELSKL
jgi:hypothetical protein